MKRIGAILAGLALAGAGMALAGEGTKQMEQGQQGSQMDEGQAGSTYGGAGMTTGQLQGKVVKADRKELFIEHMGAVVPIKLDERTQFGGTSIKKSGDLMEGQEVQVAFKVKDKIDNVATMIMLASDQAAGGAGFESGMEQDQDDAQTQPEDQANPPPVEDEKPLY